MSQAVKRTFDILETLAHADSDVSLSRLQRELQLPLSTIHRLLQVMIARGYAVQSDDDKHYGPGPKLLEVAEYVKRNGRYRLGHLARPFLQQLTKETGETSNLAIPQGHDVVYIEQVPSPRRVRMFTEVGHRAPLYCTGTGKAVLASLPDDQLEAYFSTVKLEPLTSHTLASVSDVMHELEQTRKRGFTIDDEEFEVGVRCIASPVLDAGGVCVAAMSISGPTIRMSHAHAEELGPLVSHATTLLSAQLGYRTSSLSEWDQESHRGAVAASERPT